jgi:hypothetical protein
VLVPSRHEWTDWRGGGAAFRGSLLSTSVRVEASTSLLVSVLARVPITRSTGTGMQIRRYAGPCLIIGVMGGFLVRVLVSAQRREGKLSIIGASSYRGLGETLGG